jgi:hypothetical protein
VVTPNSKGWASWGVPKVRKSCQGTAWLVYWMCNNWIQIHGNVTPFICLWYPFQYNVYFTPVRTRGNPDPQRGILVFSLWYDTSPCVSTVRMSPLTRGLVIGPMTSSSPECLPFETSVFRSRRVFLTMSRVFRLEGASQEPPTVPPSRRAPLTFLGCPYSGAIVTVTFFTLGGGPPGGPLGWPDSQQEHFITSTIIHNCFTCWGVNKGGTT